jgi:hypothetical protein
MERNAVTKLTQIQNKAKLDFETYKQKQIAQFRADLKPIAQEIASKRGLSIVIPKNEGLLLSVDPGVDITDDVIKVLRDKHPITPAASTASTDDSAKANGTKRSSAPAKSATSGRTANQTDDEETFR